jgi:hypothetical protein
MQKRMPVVVIEVVEGPAGVAGVVVVVVVAMAMAHHQRCEVSPAQSPDKTQAAV